MKPDSTAPASSPAGGTTAKDPVCGMSVIESKAAGTTVHGGRTYYFCSAHCKATFASTPEKYVGR